MKQICLFVLCSLIFGCTEETSKTLPILSYKISDSGKQEFYSIRFTKSSNQLGQPFTTESLHNKIVVTNFFFTRCPSICPPMRRELIKIANRFETYTDFLMVSQTIDPQNDTEDVLLAYAENTGISEHKWQFIRSSKKETEAQAQQFMTSFKANKDGTDFSHSSYVSLLDKKQNIRGFYNILIKEDVTRLKDDVLSLLEN